MKITKEKLRQIVLEEAIKLGKVVLNEWDYTASLPPARGGTLERPPDPDPDDFNLIDTIADAGKDVGEFASDTYEAGKDAVVKGVTDLAGGEFFQEDYGLDAQNPRDMDMENRVYQRIVEPHLDTYKNIANDYGISPELLAGVMMDHDIRMYPNVEEGIQQLYDYVPVFRDIESPVLHAGFILGGPGLEIINQLIPADMLYKGSPAKPFNITPARVMMVADEINKYLQGEDVVGGQKMGTPAKGGSIGTGSIKLDSIITDLSVKINPKTGKPWIDLDKELGITNARDEANITSLVARWLLKPENSIRAMAARLAFDKHRFKNPGKDKNGVQRKSIDLTPEQLASGYMRFRHTGKQYNPGARPKLALEMGRHWLNPQAGGEPAWWPHQSQEEIKEAVRAALKEFL
jgi:hypothetical protein